MVYACQHFRHCLYGHKTIVRTDHSALKRLMSFKDPQGQVARWIEFLGTYNLDIRHRPGAKHCNADSLSRYPCRQCGITEENEINKEEPEVNIIHAVETVKDEQDLSIRELQKEDSDLQKVKSWVADKKRPAFTEIKGESNAVKSLWSPWNSLDIVNEMDRK